MQILNKLRLKKTAILVFIVGSAYSVQSFSCACVPGCWPVQSYIWQQGVTYMGITVTKMIEMNYQILDKQWETNLKLLQSAIAVLAKQVQISGQKHADTVRIATQSQADYQNELAVSKSTFHSMLDYGFLGQGSDPCLDQYQVTAINGAMNNAEANVGPAVNSTIDASPSKYHPNPGVAQSHQSSEVKAKYCSAELKASGYCQTVSTDPNIDVSAANFFSVTAQGGARDDAKNQMVNYIYGRPDIQPPKNVANLPDTAAYMNAKREQDAFRSLSALSFKTIQSWTSVNNTGESVIGAIEKKVERYTGGDGYEDWRKSIAVQRERGLLIEYAKMKAFELQMAALDYEQMERTEAVVAGINALESRNMASTAATQANRIGVLLTAKKVN